MAHRKNQKSRGQTSVRDFVTVAFAEDQELARQYKKLLEERNIPAMVKSQPDDASSFPGVAVMVPEDLIDQAHELIEIESGCNDFFEMAFRDNMLDDDDDYDLEDQF